MSLPRLLAPKEHGQILAVPPLDQVGALLDANRHFLDCDFPSSSGQSFREMRALARREVLATSMQYHREAGEAIAGDISDTWFVAGHQPELFHPGVWFKNFALHQLGRKHGAVALSLIVDTDTAKPALLHVPSDGRLVRVPFDRSTAETPYEERTVEDESAFAALPTRMASIVERWSFEPMLASFWRDVMTQAARTPLLGERFAAARRAMERRWGVVQREVPMSRVCQTEAFALFACLILNDLPAFHASYNQIVHDYRRAHGIRSRSHPVPDLAVDGGWLEAPFWAWRRGQSRRGQLFVRRAAAAWELRVGGGQWPSIPCAAPIEGWLALEPRGFKIRSRALTTTMFARLFLADVFIHGLGGALYDELTDRLIERFFHLSPPGYVALSATLILPLPRFPDAAQKMRDLARRQRDLVYKPELFIERTLANEDLIRAKQEWIRRERSTHAERVERFNRIREINVQMLPFVQPGLQDVQSQLEGCRHQSAWNTVAGRRDYAFCLFPEEMLRTFFSTVFV